MKTPRMSELAPEFVEDPITQRAKARIGSVLRGKWRIDRLLGVGGMAAVYEGTHRNGKRGAIKMLHLEFSTDTDTRTRFLREGYVANTVNHPGAVSVFDDDVAEDGSVFIVMEMLVGKTLEELAQSRPTKRLGPLELFRLTDKLLDVLAAAHENGVIHRDVKPDNIFVTNEGNVKILDFGIARMRDVQASAKMTKTGSAMGTPAFMPPEQALGEWDRVDRRTDLWAVGATMYTMLTGRYVHEGASLNQLLLKAMTHAAPPLRSVLPNVPSAIAEPIDKVLAMDPKDRFFDARAMQTAIRQTIAWLEKNGEPQNLVPLRAENSGIVSGIAATALVSPSPTPRSRLPLLGVVAAIVFLAGMAIVFFTSSKNPTAGADASSNVKASVSAEPIVGVAGPAPTPAPTPTPTLTAAPTPTPSELAVPKASSVATTATAPVVTTKPTTKTTPTGKPTGTMFGGFN